MNHSRLAQVLIAGSATLLCAAPPPAAAQNLVVPNYIGMTPQNEGVLDRARPEYDAKGIPLGAFRLYPTLDVNAIYDDNVFRMDHGVSDWLFTIAPNVQLQSQWGRHYLGIYTGLTAFQYSKYTDENLIDWNVGSTGRYDISHSATLIANVEYAGKHEPWYSPNYTGFVLGGNYQEPFQYYQFHGQSTLEFQPDRLGFEAGGSVDTFRWINTPKVGGGFFDNHDRDENEYQFFGKVFYDFSPGYAGFVRAIYDERDFSQEPDRSGVYRTSHGYHVQGGLDLQISHLVHGEVYLGYVSQSFKAPLQDVSGIDYGIKLDYYVSPVLTLHLNGAHQLQDVTLSNISVADNKSISLGADYEFRPNVIVQASVFYVDSRYIGTHYSDQYPGFHMGVSYLLNRYVSADASYDYTSRSTDRPSDVKYNDNMLSVGLKFHL